MKCRDATFILDEVEKKAAKETEAIKCKNCESIHPAKYKLEQCPVCGYRFVQMNKKKVEKKNVL